MKKIFILLCSILLVACGAKEEKKEDISYKIIGSMSDQQFNGQNIYIYSAQGERLDSAVIDKNAFYFEGNAPFVATLVVLATDIENTDLNTTGVYIVLEPGEIKVDFRPDNKVVISGTEQNDMLFYCRELVDNYNAECERLIADTITPRGELHQKMLKAREYRNSELVSQVSKFIKTDAGRRVYEEVHLFFSPDELYTIYTSAMDNSVPLKYMPKERTQYDELLKYKFQTIDGGSVSLCDLLPNNRYTLIDLWASWCGPCIKLIPRIRELYDRYKDDDFDVVGFSLDTKRQQWINAVDKIDAPWLQVSSLQGWNCPLVQTFTINFIPTMILFDSKGEPVCSNPSIEELELFLYK